MEWFTMREKKPEQGRNVLAIILSDSGRWANILKYCAVAIDYHGIGLNGEVEPTTYLCDWGNDNAEYFANEIAVWAYFDIPILEAETELNALRIKKLEEELRYRKELVEMYEQGETL